MLMFFTYAIAIWIMVVCSYIERINTARATMNKSVR